MSQCDCVELRASDPTPTLTQCAPCVELRCASDQIPADERLDLWNTEQCATAECPDHTGQVERCVLAGAFGTTLFNATAEQIAAAQAALNAAALAEAQRLATAALDCPETDVCVTCASSLGPEWGTQNAYNAALADGIYVEDSVVCAQIEHFGSEAAAEAAAEARFQELWLNGDIECCTCAGSTTNMADLLWFGAITFDPLASGSTNTGCSFGYIQLLGTSGSFNLTPGNDDVCFYAGEPGFAGGFCTLSPQKITITIVVATGGLTGSFRMKQPDDWTFEGGYTVMEPDGFGGEVPWRYVDFAGPGTYTLICHAPSCSQSSLLTSIGGVATGTLNYTQENE